MVEPGSPLLAFSDHAAELVERVAGSIVAVDAAGAVAVAPSPAAGEGRVVGSVSLSAGASLVDAALFSGSHAGLALDSAGAVHAFGATDPGLATVASGSSVAVE